MRSRIAHVDCPCCPVVLEHHGYRPRLPEALELHVSMKHPSEVGSSRTRRRLVRAAWADVRVAVWNMLVRSQPRAWDHP